MKKNNKVMFLLPYRLKCDYDTDEIIKFLRRKKRRLFYLFVFTVVFALCVFTLFFLSLFGNISGYFLMVSAILNVVVCYYNYRQADLTDEEIKDAVDLYRAEKNGSKITD